MTIFQPTSLEKKDNQHKSALVQNRIFQLFGVYCVPEGPSTQYLRTLVPKDIPESSNVGYLEPLGMASRKLPADLILPRILTSCRLSLAAKGALEGSTQEFPGSP